MTWPFRPRVVVVKIDGLADLVAALNAHAAARVKSAEILRGHHDPAPPEQPKRPEPSDYEQRYKAALATMSVDENRRHHLAGALAVLVGRLPCPSWTTLGELRKEVEEAGLPLPG